MRNLPLLTETIGRLAVTSLLYEVGASPKPGLVDRYNQGAHKDMDFFTFMRSSAVLQPYFCLCAKRGAEFKEAGLDQLFSELRPLGISAEKDMFAATGGVNTHKGLIFSMGIVCAASGYCARDDQNQPLNTEKIFDTVRRMTHGLCRRDLAFMAKSEGLTKGETLYKLYGLVGVRGEAESGFATVRRLSLPLLRQLKAEKEYSLNDIFVETLLHLMAVNEDTNIVARHDLETLAYVRKYAGSVLDDGGMLSSPGKQRVFEMDQDLIKRNISPGGSADLLAVTIFLDLLSEVMERCE